jgi:DNA mismatch repair protein MutL
LIEKDKNLILVDQHNAHERHNFDKLKDNYKNNALESSLPLFPIIMEFTEKELVLLEEKKQILLKTGFELVKYSGNSFNIKKFPSIMNEKDIRDAINEIIYLKGKQIEIEDKIFAEVACKSAIKINHPLLPEEMRIIVRNLYNSSNPYFCPHGRPIIINFTLEYIEKQLKRK